MAGLEIVSPGPHTTVQDSGRVGFQRIGLPRSGPLDRIAFRLANALVGNAEGAPCLEMLLQGPTLRVLADSVRVAIVGSSAEMEVRAEHPKRIPPGRSVRLVRGEILRVGALGDSVCAYLAIEGGIDVPHVLGSQSTYVRAAIGGFHGRRLQARDVLPLKRQAVEVNTERALPGPFDLRLEDPIHVVLGPQIDYFTPEAIRTLLTSAFVVSPQADRMGYRLQGPVLAHEAGYDIVSDGIVSGAIQVPGSGQPIVLMVDNQTTGGYPKIATVVSADLPLVARRKPGRTIRFVEVDVSQAELLRKEQEATLLRTIGAITPAAAEKR